MVIDRFDLAQKLMSLAQSAATAARDPDLRKRVVSQAAEVKALAAEWQTVQAAISKLQIEPNDASACGQYGRFLALGKGNWDAGLELLSRSDDFKLAELARRDRESPIDAADQLKVADGWWEAAANKFGTSRAELRIARCWFERAMPQLPSD